MLFVVVFACPQECLMCRDDRIGHDIPNLFECIMMMVKTLVFENKKISLKECVELVTHMAELVNSWEQPIDTGEVPQDGQVFDAIVVGGGLEVHLPQGI